MALPYLSIVIASRNDTYTTLTLRQLQSGIECLLEQVERSKLVSELTLVDWNPSPNIAPLREALSWPSRTEYCTIRVIEVPPTLHRCFRFAEKLPFLGNRARNVGIRRARGEFIVALPTDILLSNALVQLLAAGALKTDRMYRVDRYDVPADVMRLPKLEAKLAFCEENVTNVHRREGSYRIKSLPGEVVLHTNGAGDFTLLSREFWFKLHGNPEEVEAYSVHFDGVLCYMALRAGAKEEVLEDPSRIYHIEHKSMWRPAESWLQRCCSNPLVPKPWAEKLGPFVRGIAPTKSRLDIKGIPYLNLTSREGASRYEDLIRGIMNGTRPVAYNDDSWGLPSETLPEFVIACAKWDSYRSSRIW